MRPKNLFVCLIATLCTGVALAQTSIDPAYQRPDATSSPVAYVYVQTSNGTVLYDASSSGKLTLVAGSPFNTSGLLIGSNGKYYITLGIHDLHTYKIAADGALGPQTSQFDTQSYAGGQCGTTAGAVLDHSGQDVYVSLKGAPAGDGNNLCDALQASSLSSSSGMFTFKGDLVVDDDSKTSGSDTLPVLLGNNKFAYSLEGIADGCEQSINIFARESSGALEFAAGQNVTFPVGPSGGYYYYPLFPSHVSSPVVSVWPSLITDDATGHLAIALYAEKDAPCGTTKAPQLGSFTADSKGNLTTTNTSANMPSVASGINVMRMSPSGNLLAVATGTGVQIFHFNGSSPITKFTGVIGTTGFIRDLQWDKSNHLYAINGASGNLHVYTITTTTAVEAAGSPYAVGGTHLAVVPK
jgi:hypothetical protein